MGDTAGAAIWPWAEHNAGLLSFVQGAIAVIALIVALVALWREYSAVRRAQRDKIRAFIDTVVSIVGDLVTLGEKILTDAPNNTPTQLPQTHLFAQERRAAFIAIADLRTAMPADPQLALAVGRLKLRLDPTTYSSPIFRGTQDATGWLRGELQAIQSKCDDVKERRI